MHLNFLDVMVMNWSLASENNLIFVQIIINYFWKLCCILLKTESDANYSGIGHTESKAIYTSIRL